MVLLHSVETAKKFFVSDPLLKKGVFRPDDFTVWLLLIHQLYIFLSCWAGLKRHAFKEMRLSPFCGEILKSMSLDESWMLLGISEGRRLFEEIIRMVARTFGVIPIMQTI